MSISHSDAWPPLPYAEWGPTKETLHRYTQIVGKIRMALVPFRNHWWHVTLLPATRGLSTGPMPDGDRDVEIAFDFVDHRLRITTSDHQSASWNSGDGRRARTSTTTCSLPCTISGSTSRSILSRTTSARAQRSQPTACTPATTPTPSRGSGGSWPAPNTC